MVDQRCQDVFRKEHQIELVSQIRAHAFGTAYVARLPSGVPWVPAVGHLRPGLILKARGNLDGAMNLHEEVEEISREFGSPASLATSLTNQALLLSQRMSKPADALPLAEEAYRLVADRGVADLEKWVKSVLDGVRSKLG